MSVKPVLKGRAKSLLKYYDRAASAEERQNAPESSECRQRDAMRQRMFFHAANGDSCREYFLIGSRPGLSTDRTFPVLFDYFFRIFFPITTIPAEISATDSPVRSPETNSRTSDPPTVPATALQAMPGTIRIIPYRIFSAAQVPVCGAAD